MRSAARVSLAVGAVILLYLLLWPVPIDPVAWEAPPNPGYRGPYARNARLDPLEELSIGDAKGPEDLALGDGGEVYAATHDGRILVLDPDGGVRMLANTGGRPLGIELDRSGDLIVADAMRGLLAVTPRGEVQVLTDTAAGVPIRYADDVDIAPDGRIYFSDASTKFGAAQFGGTYPASLLDINEHGGHGRLLEYDPGSKQTRVLLDGLQFANGVAVTHDGTAVLVCETGNYRVLLYWLQGPRRGQHAPFIEHLPGFPDNISRGLGGRYWLALVTPRNRLLDGASDQPFVRKVIQRLPGWLRPAATPYGHVLGLAPDGEVLHDLQRPQAVDLYTSVTETETHLYLGSLTAPVLRRLSKGVADLPLTSPRTGFSIASDPPAFLFVDDDPFGLTPVVVDDLSPGTHVIDLDFPGYQRWRSQLDARRGEVLELPSVTLRPDPHDAEPRQLAYVPDDVPGRLRINTRPWTKVYVNGELVGNTPQMNIELEPGTHAVVLENREAGVRKVVRVKIEPGQTVTRVYDLFP